MFRGWLGLTGEYRPFYGDRLMAVQRNIKQGQIPIFRFEMRHPLRNLVALILNYF